MSEPVGNSPRGDISGNSHKLRESAPVAPPREPVEKVVTGKVVIKKPPFWKRAARSMVADDVENVGEFLVTDVLIPQIKTLIFEMITQGSSKTLFGSAKNRRSIVGERSSSGVSTMKRTNYGGMSEERTLPREARARHDFDPIKLETRAEATMVIDEMLLILGEYHRVSVADLYNLLGVTPGFTDQRWGWTNLDAADVRQIGGGYFLLDLPSPVQLR